MKTTLLYTFLLLIGFSISSISYSQCTPGNATSCPDTENNGEVCPAVLPNGIIGQEYSQEFTIIAPPEYNLDGTIIPLHHIKIVDVDNLPSDVTWESNATDSVFMVGTYYCVLLSGLCDETGDFPLKIVVDVYIDVFGNPVYATQITDSTSISLKVTWDPDGIKTYQDNKLNIKLWPNPFKDEILFSLGNSNNSVKVELYSILGNRIINKGFDNKPNNDQYRMNCSHLPNGTYMLSVTSGNKRVSKLIRKSP